jgi:hypothetical protein
MNGPEEASATATAFAERLARACADVLGDLVVAALLHGSLTLGDFVPGRSDVDLLLVVGRRLQDRELSALAETAGALSAGVPHRVDLRLVTRGVAATPSPAPPLEAGFAFRPGHPPEVERRVAGEPDLVVEFSVVRAHGRAIFGPGPRSVIGAVPPAWVDAAGDRALAAWQHLTDDAPHAELMVLTTCRVWRHHSERVHCSKSAAGHWALARDPSLIAVRDALRQRRGEPGVAIQPDDIGRLLALVRRALAAR